MLCMRMRCNGVGDTRPWSAAGVAVLKICPKMHDRQRIGCWRASGLAELNCTCVRPHLCSRGGCRVACPKADPSMSPETGASQLAIGSGLRSSGPGVRSRTVREATTFTGRAPPDLLWTFNHAPKPRVGAKGTKHRRYDPLLPLLPLPPRPPHVCSMVRVHTHMHVRRACGCACAPVHACVRAPVAPARMQQRMKRCMRACMSGRLRMRAQTQALLLRLRLVVVCA